jgi:formylglycine-generating enzyme required for sulfatase activity
MAVLKTEKVLRRRLLQEIRARVPRGATVTVTLLLATFVVASACQIVGGYESFQPHPCNVLPSSKLDEKGIALLVLSKQPDGTCYWIDKTEVTVQQYSQFLTEVAQPVGWAGACAWKDTPSDPIAEAEQGSAGMNDPCIASTSVESDPFSINKPIRCVDWCDARAFCNWAGKDLCGGLTDGSFVGPPDVPDQWGGACSTGGLPYVNGATAILDQCNVGLGEAGECPSALQQNICAPTDVGSFPECTGPYGTVDMIGNVAEWVLSCGNSVDGGADTLCQHRGGSFADSLESATCYALGTDTVATRVRALGLRCCAALTVDEKSLE